MRDEFWLEDQSPDLFDIEDDQTPDTFGAFSGVLVGPPGPPGPQGPPGADGTVSFDELTPAQRESLRGEGVPAGGTTGQVLAKASNTDYATEWVDQSGGGTSDYTDLTNKPSINNVTLSGNKTAAQLGLATPSDIPTVPVQSVNSKTGAVVLSASDVSALPLAGGTMSGDIDMDGNAVTGLPTPTANGDAVPKSYADTKYTKPSGGIPASDLASAVQTSLGLADSALQAVPSTYRTAAAQDAIDADMAKADEVGIVISGARPSMVVAEGQYVIVRNSTISGITDGLYTANAALSPSTDVTAADLSPVSGGGLNALKAELSIKSVQVSLGDLPSLTPQSMTGTLSTPLSQAPSAFWLGKVNTSSNGGGLIIKVEAFYADRIVFLAYNPREGATTNIRPLVYYIE